MGLISNGTTVFDNGAMASGFSGAMTFIASATASSSSSLDFTSGISSTYKEYKFYFVDIHPASDQTFLQFQADTGTNTSYNQTVTSTYFTAYHDESDSGAALTYNTSYDLAQAPDFITIADRTGTDNDQCIAGSLHVFDPASTTFVKHYYATTQWQFKNYGGNLQACESFVSGYFNTTSAVDAVRFQMTGGAHFTGTLKMYGLWVRSDHQS